MRLSQGLGNKVHLAKKKSYSLLLVYTVQSKLDLMPLSLREGVSSISMVLPPSGKNV